MPGLSDKMWTRGVLRAAWLRAIAIALSLAGHSQLTHAQSCSSKATSDILIVLDVGHTATQPGATSARGVPEYEFNMNLAVRIREELQRAGFDYTYLMVTQLDGTAGLNERADQANNMNADIFLSIHHDGVVDSLLRPWTYQGEQHLFFDESKGFSLHVSPRYEASLRLAQNLADKLLDRGLSFNTVHEPGNPAGARVPYLDSTRGIYQRDNLVVLNRTKMPAVLLEAGVIVNRDEELAVQKPAYKSAVAVAVTDAVKRFCGRATSTYRVVKVGSDDVLNIRSGPDTSWPIVGTVPPNGRGVRIIGGCSGLWCPVDYGGTRGWVNSQYLSKE